MSSLNIELWGINEQYIVLHKDDWDKIVAILSTIAVVDTEQRKPQKEL